MHFALQFVSASWKVTLLREPKRFTTFLALASKKRLRCFNNSSSVQHGIGREMLQDFHTVTYRFLPFPPLRLERACICTVWNQGGLGACICDIASEQVPSPERSFRSSQGRPSRLPLYGGKPHTSPHLKVVRL